MTSTLGRKLLYGVFLMVLIILFVQTASSKRSRSKKPRLHNKLCKKCFKLNRKFEFLTINAHTNKYKYRCKKKLKSRRRKLKKCKKCRRKHCEKSKYFSSYFELFSLK